MDQQTILTYIQNNTIPTKPGRKCVDGRYVQDENSGMIARPGGDLGYAMVLLALSEKKGLNISPEKCFDVIFEALQKLSEKFYMHTDHHADPTSVVSSQQSVASIGCGHAGKPMNEELASAYELDALDEKRLVAHAKNLSVFWKEKGDDSVVLVNLPGEHKEEAVIVNTGREKTVNSQDTHHMFFIYDKTRDMEFIEKLVQALDIPEITVKEFKEMSDIQTNATLHNLAHEKEIFEVNLDEKSPQINPAGTVS